MSEQSPPSARRRDAAATRAALLQAATELFTERGFDHTTVRDIATRAGVNQALLFRYFGSKNDLFEEVVNGKAQELLQDGPAAELPQRVLRHMLSESAAGQQNHPLYALLRSSSHGQAAGTMRRELGRTYVQAMAGLTEGPDAELRASLALAWLVGIGFARSVLNSEQLVDADPELVEAYVGRGFAALLEKIDQKEH